MTTAKTKKTTPVDEASQAAGEALDAMVSAGQETMATMIKAGVDACTEGYEKAVSLGAGQFGSQNAAYDKATAMGKENIETATAVASAWSAGFEIMSGRFVDNLKKATAFNVDVMSRLAAAKSPQDFAAIQMEAATKSVDLAVAETVEFNKIAADTFAKAATPVKSRLDKMVDAMVTPVV